MSASDVLLGRQAKHGYSYVFFLCIGLATYAFAGHVFQAGTGCEQRLVIENGESYDTVSVHMLSSCQPEVLYCKYIVSLFSVNVFVSGSLWPFGE